jgi:hypothetical protein
MGRRGSCLASRCAASEPECVRSRPLRGKRALGKQAAKTQQASRRCRQARMCWGASHCVASGPRAGKPRKRGKRADESASQNVLGASRSAASERWASKLPKGAAGEPTMSASQPFPHYPFALSLSKGSGFLSSQTKNIGEERSPRLSSSPASPTSPSWSPSMNSGRTVWGKWITAIRAPQTAPPDDEPVQRR